jgi:hypothetical protein
MRFPPMTPMPFRRDEVEAIDGGQWGIYGLLRGETWIFIGSGEIRGRLLAHLEGEPASVTRERPDRWVAVATPRAEEWTPKLIETYRPLCNPP